MDFGFKVISFNAALPFFINDHSVQRELISNQCETMVHGTQITKVLDF